MRRDRRTLPENHKHWLHANAAVSDMGGAQADRNEQIVALTLLGNDRAIANGIGFDGYLNVTFVVGFSVANDSAAIM